MPDPALPHLTDWGNFYVIIGSAAAGLTGLMFVVITLGAQAQTIGSEKGIRAFVTPTVVHFCSALMIAVYMSSPGQSPKSLGIGTAVGGIAGLTYVVWAMRAAHRLREYEPVGSDWMWHAAYPILAYLHPHRRRGDVLHGAHDRRALHARGRHDVSPPYRHPQCLGCRRVGRPILPTPEPSREKESRGSYWTRERQVTRANANQLATYG
jgi:hypothetical protein